MPSMGGVGAGHKTESTKPRGGDRGRSAKQGCQRPASVVLKKSLDELRRQLTEPPQTGPFLGKEQQWVEAFKRAKARKEKTYPELAGEGGRQIGGPCCRSGWTLVKRSFPVRAFFGVGQRAECSGVHPNPSGTRMESEMEETFGMHNSKVIREHVAGARVTNRCPAQHPQKLM